MSRASIVSFAQYQPQGITDYYHNYFEYYKRTLGIWGKEVDKVYIVSQDWEFTDRDRQDLSKLTNDYQIVRGVSERSYAGQFTNLLPMVEEDEVMLMDSDMFIYQKGFVKKCFDRLQEGYGLVGIFDGSGGMRDVVWNKFPELKKRNYLRMAPYLSITKRENFADLEPADWWAKQYPIGTYIKELDYHTVEGDWSDPLGEATLKILSKNPNVYFVPDDRSSLYFMPDHTITEANTQPHTGCYHLRNWNMGLHLINEHRVNPDSHDRFLATTPIQEAFRLLGWLWTIAEQVGGLNASLQKDILAEVIQYGASKDEWEKYIVKFHELHDWVKI